MTVEVSGTRYELAIEQLPGSNKYKVSGTVRGQRLEIERRGFNPALAGWRVAAQQKLRA